MTTSVQRNHQLEAAEAEVVTLRADAARREQQLAVARQYTADLKQEVHPLRQLTDAMACCPPRPCTPTCIMQLPGNLWRQPAMACVLHQQHARGVAPRPAVRSSRGVAELQLCD
jgi:hypothetical protein